MYKYFISFHLQSPSGEEGFGDCIATLRHEIRNEDDLNILREAIVKRDSALALCHIVIINFILMETL
jgi:hypothetical protein